MKCGLLSSPSLEGEPGVDIWGTGTVILRTESASPRFGRLGIVFRWVLVVTDVLKPGYM